VRTSGGKEGGGELAPFYLKCLEKERIEGKRGAVSNIVPKEKGEVAPSRGVGAAQERSNLLPFAWRGKRKIGDLGLTEEVSLFRNSMEKEKKGGGPVSPPQRSQKKEEGGGFFLCEGEKTPHAGGEGATRAGKL